MTYFSNLKFHSVKNCFIKIPNFIDIHEPVRNGNVIAVKLETKTGALISSATAHNSSSDRVELNGIYGAKQGLKDDQEVIITVLKNVPKCKRVFVEPASIDDWEIIETNSSFLEEHMLNQVRIVKKNQILPIWAQGSLCLFIKIGKTEPDCECVCLAENTEVIVKPLPRSNDKSSNELNIRQTSDLPKSDLTIKSDSNDMRYISTDVQKDSIANALINSSSLSTSLSSSSVDPFKFEMSNLYYNDVSRKSFLKSTLDNLKYSYSSYFCKKFQEKPKISLLDANNFKLGKKCFFRALSLEKFLIKNEDFAKLNCLSFEKNISSDNNCLKVDKSGNDNNANYFHTKPFDIFLSKSYLENFINRKIFQKEFISSMSKFYQQNDNSQMKKDRINEQSKSDVNEQKESTAYIENVLVTVHLLDNAEFRSFIKKPFHNFVLIPSSLRTLLNVNIGDKVYLQDVLESRYSLKIVEKLYACPLFSPPDGFTYELLTLSLKNYFQSVMKISQTSTILLNELTIVNCFLTNNSMGRFVLSCHDLKGSVKAEKNSSRLIYHLFEENIEKMEITFRSDTSKIPNFMHDNLDNSVIKFFEENYKADFLQDAIKCINDYVDFLEEFSSKYKNSFNPKPGNILVYGPKGVGKTTFCKYFKQNLESRLSSYYVSYIDFRELIGKSIGNVKQKLNTIFNNLKYSQPSVVIFDNLDMITSGDESNHDTDLSALDRHLNKLSLSLRYFLLDLLNDNNNNNSNGLIFALATSESMDSINKSFLERHVFFKFIPIKVSPDKDKQQLLFLKNQINSIIKSMPHLNIKNCISEHLNSSKLEGYVTFDLEVLAKQTIHKKLTEIKTRGLNDVKNGIIEISDEDVHETISSYTPLHLRLSKLSDPPIIGLKDVGGLKAIKEILIESLMWPSTYPKLFKNYPLPLRTGILLYGAQGTGKTLLASAVASECRMNLITVKGPELLNKFIGASEKAVRDTFEKAKNASPCIIFFDELDSLAPCRGKDSTGVTDRVVNQLLAELDGVEQLEGVYILAATSRPDLIDPALLRPGRLDKLLHCPVPNVEERFEILKALTRSINLADDVDLEELSKNTDNFTGADLKALLYNALLEVVHQFQDGHKTNVSPDENIENMFAIKNEHLILAISKTEPSLQKDKRNMNEIYSSFNKMKKVDVSQASKTVGIKAIFA